jgi:hypothetical protein
MNYLIRYTMWDVIYLKTLGPSELFPTCKVGGGGGGARNLPTNVRLNC